MHQRTVSIMLRVNEGHGNQPYYQAVVAANGSIKPSYALIEATCMRRTVLLPATGTKLESGITNLPAPIRAGSVMQLQRQHVHRRGGDGPAAVDPPQPPGRRRSLPWSSFRRSARQPSGTPGRIEQSSCHGATVDKFVREMTAIRSRGRAYGCRLQLGLFLKTFKKAYLERSTTMT